MLGKALYLFFFWRRNDWRSIVFKTIVWWLIAWLIASLFSSSNQSFYIATAFACFAGLRYSLLNHFETQRLLALVKGDQQQLKYLKSRLHHSGIAGALMSEMLRTEMEQNNDLLDSAEVGAELQAANLIETRRVLNHVTDTCLAGGFITHKRYNQSRAQLLDEYGDGQLALSIDVALEECLPERVLSFAADEHNEDDDHAALVRAFAAATGGMWVIKNCTSYFDVTTNRWTVALEEANNVTKTWRFEQHSDLLSETFLEQLVRYTELRTNHAVTVLDSEDVITVVCLPLTLHHALCGSGEKEISQLFAA